MMKNLHLVWLLIPGVVSSCSNHENEPGAVSLEEKIVDSVAAECPYVTKDTAGNAVLSWVRIIDDSTTAFCYATWNEQQGFVDTVVIPGTANIKPHGENLPKIIFKPSGETIALWGAANPNPNNKYSGLVFYAQSFDNGKSWSEPSPLVKDSMSYDQRYFDVAILPDGEAGIIWLDNRKNSEQEGSGLHFAKTHGDHGFMHERLIAQPCCPCCRTDLFVDSKANIHALYRGIIKDSIRDMVHSVSLDGAKTFSSPSRISDDNWIINGCPHTGPAMAETAEGLQFAWFTGGTNKGCYYAHSKDNGTSFSPRDKISAFGSHPQLVSFPDNSVVIVWDEMNSRGNNHYKRIALQRRAAGNLNDDKIFITPETGRCSYPVVADIGLRKALVAYTSEQEGRKVVAYRVVQL